MGIVPLMQLNSAILVGAESSRKVLPEGFMTNSTISMEDPTVIGSTNIRGEAISVMSHLPLRIGTRPPHLPGIRPLHLPGIHPLHPPGIRLLHPPGIRLLHPPGIRLLHPRGLVHLASPSPILLRLHSRATSDAP
jgi:hypothetical protein